MFVALDMVEKHAVTGPEVSASAAAPPPLKPTATEVQRTAAGAPRFRCVCCDAPLRYVGAPESRSLDWFGPDCECSTDGNMSTEHRLGQELVVKALFNLLPTDRATTTIELERRIGTARNFVIADVRVTQPVNLAVEVVYMTSQLGLQRRLRTFFTEGYPAMISVLTTAKTSAQRLERQLGKVGPIHVGQVDPRTLSVQLGSVITPDHVDLETPVWNSLPAYI